MNSRRGGSRAVAGAVAALAVLGAASGCGGPSRVSPPEVPDGDPLRGAELLSVYGCNSCHAVEGVAGADGVVGPPLTNISERVYIAGELAMSGPNMQRWIRDPQGIEPGTAMPDLGVTAEDARDITAYLFSEQ